MRGSSFPDDRVHHRRNRLRENRLHLPSRPGCARCVWVSAAKGCGGKYGKDGGCRKGHSQLDGASVVHGSIALCSRSSRLQRHARQIQFPPAPQAQRHLDSRELLATSVGNYSRQATLRRRNSTWVLSEPYNARSFSVCVWFASANLEFAERQTRNEHPMHQIAACTAIRPVLIKLNPNLIETVEGRAKIERMVWDIMKSLDQGGLRFVSAKEN